MSAQSNASPKPAPAASLNRLVGWLVSYGLDDKGAAYEIRAGRSFISSRAMGDQKIITLAETGISAPHLAVSASPRHKVMVQDIFSEQGSFIAKSSNEKEVPITGPVDLEHGDWIRIGQKIRFQVCLIDGPGR